MARYVTVTPAAVRSVAATITARTVAVSRRYLFASAARASIAASRTVAAALSRGRTALVPVRAARLVVADVVARRALAAAAMSDRLVDAALGAARRLLAAVVGGRFSVGNMVRRRPGAGTVLAARVAVAAQIRGGAASASVSGSRTVGVAPYTSTVTGVAALTDANDAGITDSSGQNLEANGTATIQSYLRWRVLVPAVLGVRTVTASPVAKRLLSAGAVAVRTAAALPLALRRLAATFIADPTVPRLTALPQRLSRTVATVSAARTVTVGLLGIKPLTATYPGATQISASLFNSTVMTDSDGNPITDSTSVQFSVLI
jgi:hypothetical protein